MAVVDCGAQGGGKEHAGHSCPGLRLSHNDKYILIKKEITMILFQFCVFTGRNLVEGSP